MGECKNMEESTEIKKIKNFSLNVRKNILEMAVSAGASSAHFGGALSITEIISTLFAHQMKIDKKNPTWEERDRFILSKGHACLVLYSALLEKKIIGWEQVKNFEKDNSDFPGHPVKNQDLGIEFSTGSLGMGIGLSIGVAIALRKKKLNNHIFVLLGDGECNEGSVWEAAMAAPNFKLENLYAIIDKNNFQQTGANKDIMNVDSLKDKWSSFGWHTEEIDGHKINKICEVFEKTKSINKPKAIIANTIKGKGFSFSENNNDWHHSVLNKSFYDKAIAELEKK